MEGKDAKRDAHAARKRAASRKEREFHHDSLQDEQTIVRYLEALTDGFQKGKLTFSNTDHEITLEPRGLVRFEVGTVHRSDRVSVSLKFSWKTGARKKDEDGPLYINGSSD